MNTDITENKVMDKILSSFLVIDSCGCSLNDDPRFLDNWLADTAVGSFKSIMSNISVDVIDTRLFLTMIGLII